MTESEHSDDIRPRSSAAPLASGGQLPPENGGTDPSPEMRAELAGAHWAALSELSACFSFTIRVRPDGSCGVMSVSAQHAALTRTDRRHFVSIDDWITTFASSDARRAWRFFERLRSGRSASGQVTIATSLNEHRELLLRGIPVWDRRKQRLAYLCGAARDITNSRRLQSALAIQRDLGVITSGPGEQAAGRLSEVLTRIEPTRWLVIAIANGESAPLLVLRATNLNASTARYMAERGMAYAEQQLTPQRSALFLEGGTPTRRQAVEMLDMTACKSITILPAYLGTQCIAAAMLGSDAVPPRSSRRLIEAVQPTVSMVLANLQFSHRTHRTHRELAQRAADAEDFVGSVSHDLKSPLVTISGMLQILRQRIDPENEELSRPVDAMERASAQMQRAISELLELTRMGGVQPQFTSFSVAELIDEVVAPYEAVISDRNVILRVPERGPTVTLDRVALSRILDNLVSNALTHAAGEPGTHLTVEADLEDDQLHLVVRDSGPGVDPKDHLRIFRVFERVEETGEGTGMGLAIVKRLAERDGGQVWVDSHPGQGAAFHVVLPIRREEA